MQGLDYNQAKIRKTFGIILAAKRPLTLSEFKFALAIETHHQNLEGLKTTQEKESNFLTYPQNDFGDFITMRDNTITYSHESVKDFFFNKLNALEAQEPETYNSKIGTWLDLSKEKADAIIAKSCILFLKLDDFIEPRASFDKDLEIWEATGFGTMHLDGEPNSPGLVTPITPVAASLDQDSRMFNIPFYDYAASKWGYHYADNKPLNSEILEEDDLLRLLTQGDLMENWSSVFRKDHSGGTKLPQELNELLIASYFGYTRFFRKLLPDSQFKASRERALTWACRMGHYEIVKHSLEDRVSYTEDVLDGQSAFSWAVAEGFTEIVKLMLDKDPSLVSTRSGDGNSPLSLAVENGHSQITRRLLSMKVINVNLSNKYGIRAIHMAVGGPVTSTEDSGILQMLLNRPNLDIMARNRRGRTILWYAADLGAIKIIKRVLGCR